MMKKSFPANPYFGATRCLTSFRMKRGMAAQRAHLLSGLLLILD
jgi:hypothetical protein